MTIGGKWSEVIVKREGVNKEEVVVFENRKIIIRSGSSFYRQPPRLWKLALEKIYGLGLETYVTMLSKLSHSGVIAFWLHTCTLTRARAHSELIITEGCSCPHHYIYKINASQLNTRLCILRASYLVIYLKGRLLNFRLCF